MATELTIDDLKNFRIEINQIYNDAMNNAEKEFERGKLSQSQFDDATTELQRLKLQSTKLLGLIMGMSLEQLLNTDIDSPSTKIKIAADKLKEASQKIQNFLDFLQSVAEVIRIASGIILAIQTGAIVKI